MVRIIKAIIKCLFTPLFKLMSFFDKRKLCVIFVDGGLGSQINKLAIGLNMEAHGYYVKYDLTPFKKGQKDINGLYNRNLDIDKVYKKNDGGGIRIASKFDILYSKLVNVYKSKDLFLYDERLFFQKAPVYVGGYIDNIAYWTSVRKQLVESCSFEMNLSEKALAFLEKIKNNKSAVVVHVRRGDYVGSVYDVVTPEYYKRAVSWFLTEIKNPCFFFFSNDIQWVKDCLLSQLPKNLSCEFADFNDNDKGFNDIAMMRCSENFILSNSSFSIMGAFFSLSDNKRIVMPEKWVKEKFGGMFDLSVSEQDFIMLSQKAHDITGKTVFLQC